MGPDYDTPRMWGEDEPEEAAWTATPAALTKQGERGPDNESPQADPRRTGLRSGWSCRLKCSVSSLRR
jgi:hypothetical protein